MPKYPIPGPRARSVQQGPQGQRARRAAPPPVGGRGWRILVLVLLIVTFGEVAAVQQATFRELPADGWRLVTDGVMGGVSRGTLTAEEIDGRRCLALRGRVSTENNGGFIQLALDLDDALRDATAYDGIRLDVIGNAESYNVHLRTADLWLPWQSYRASFTAPESWSSVFLPFDGFEPYKTGAELRLDRLRRIGIVAIGRDFDADVCIGSVALRHRAE